METERGYSPEYERMPPHIRLEFFRHDEKSVPTTSGERPNDRTVRLTDAGRRNATAVGKRKQPRAEVAVAYGSERERSSETALRQMLANEDVVTPEMSLEAMRTVIDQQLKVGRKDAVSKNLDFTFEGNQTYRDTYMERYLKSKDALVFAWKESDQLARRLKDETSSTYSRFAGNVAELVDKYVRILPRWQEIAAEHPEKYAASNFELQRFFGSHQGVIEPLVMKVIEKTQGAPAVEAFINTLPDKNGFGSSQGFSVDIADEGGSPHMTVRCNDQQWTVTPEVLSEIIGERDALNQEIRAAILEDQGRG